MDQEVPMTIELYVFPPSPRSFKVMAVANHLGLEWTMHMIDLRKVDQKSPEYATLNPNMRMPTLKDGDFVLWESNAIGQYLASKRPDSDVWAEGRARAARGDALAVLGPRALGPGLRGLYL
jgi:glutathione S-transferase